MNASTHSEKPEKKKNPKAIWAKRALAVCFLILVPALLFALVRNIEWQEVTTALKGYNPLTLMLVAAIALTGYGVYSSFDLLGRAYTKQTLPAKRVIPVAFVSYAFNLNLGAWVGSVAMRYRLYSRLGLDVATTTRVLSLSLITNWLGYLFLAGLVFSFRLVPLPGNWQIGTTALQIIGILLLVAASSYLLACAFSKRRLWHFRDHEVNLPSFTVALTQLGLGSLNWLLAATIIFVLLPEGAFFPTVLGILLISAIAGVITHIPAGLGVLEAVYIALLQQSHPVGSILAALIAYRAAYFLLPLMLACVVYALLEKQAKHLKANDAAPSPESAASRP